MNYKKSMKRKHNDKIRNTRKNNKKGGVIKTSLFKVARKTIPTAVISNIPTDVISKIPGKPFMPAKDIAKYMINQNDPRSNVNLFKKGIEELHNQSVTAVAKKGIDMQPKQQPGPAVDVKKALQSKKKPPSIKPDDRIKFSELASEDWFSSVNNLTRKINKSRQNAKYLLDLNELVDKYEGEKEEEDKKKILEEIGLIIRFMTDEDAKKYGIDREKKGHYIPDASEIKKQMQQLKKEATFTYNLLKNVDLSPKEIQTAYCKKWTKDICKPEDTPMMLMKRMLYYYVFEAPSHTSNIKSNVITSVKKETKPVKPSNNKRTYSVYVPGYGVSINPVATVKTVYGAIFGFDDKWLNHILGILIPIVNDIFNDIKESEENTLDFITLLVSNMSGKTEKEMDELFENHENIRKLKDELNEFFKKNADSFSQEYTNTQFIGISHEFQKKMTTAVTKEMKDKIAKQILTIATGLRKFERELLLFINAQDNLDEFDKLLKTNKESIETLQIEAIKKL
jgi:hypothetical protein